MEFFVWWWHHFCILNRTSEFTWGLCFKCFTYRCFFTEITSCYPALLFPLLLVRRSFLFYLNRVMALEFYQTLKDKLLIHFFCSLEASLDSGAANVQVENKVAIKANVKIFFHVRFLFISLFYWTIIIPRQPISASIKLDEPNKNGWVFDECCSNFTKICTFFFTQIVSFQASSDASMLASSWLSITNLAPWMVKPTGSELLMIQRSTVPT